jgi:hypothetical protein
VLSGCGSGASSTSGATTPAGSSTPASNTNGIEKLAPGAAAAKARAAFKTAPAVRVKGEVTESGEVISFDSRITAAGGRTTMKQQGQSVDVLFTKGAIYMSGDLAFWKGITGSPASATTMVGKYLKISPSSTQAKDLLGFVDRAELADNMLPGANDGFTSGTVTSTSAGQRVFALSDGQGAYDVALEGEPYPVRMSGPGVTMEFSYGGTVDLTPPPASKVTVVRK